MTAQTFSGVVNFDSPSILGLVHGDSITMNGGELIIDSDIKLNQNSSVISGVTLTTIYKNKVTVTGKETWEIPISIGSKVYSCTSLLIGADSATVVDESPNPKVLNFARPVSGGESLCMI